MSNRIKELEKEIELTRELLRLRAQLNAAKVVEASATGGLTPTALLGGTDLRSLGLSYDVGKVDLTTISAGDTTYKKLKFGEDSKVKVGVTESQWEDSAKMWSTATVPSYCEGRGPCDCA